MGCLRAPRRDRRIINTGFSSLRLNPALDIPGSCGPRNRKSRSFGRSRFERWLTCSARRLGVNHAPAAVSPKHQPDTRPATLLASHYYAVSWPERQAGEAEGRLGDVMVSEAPQARSRIHLLSLRLRFLPTSDLRLSTISPPP